MAYYDALIAKWAEAPAGTNEEKITWINALTVDGPPKPMVVEARDMYNKIDRAEYEALDEPMKQSVKDLLAMGTIDASVGTPMRARWVEIFPAGTTTNTNLMEYAEKFDEHQVPWWSAPPPEGGGLTSPVSMADLESAGIV